MEKPFSRKGLYPKRGSHRLREHWALLGFNKLSLFVRAMGSTAKQHPLMLFRRIVLIGIVCSGVWFGYVLFTLPDVDEVGALFAAESSVITDRHGVELYRIYSDEDRTLVPLDTIANETKWATIAIEDQRFYERGCFDPRAFLRAVLRNIVGGFGSQGGSTITQQFSKNALIGSRKKRVTRKIKEYILSCKLEKRYSKDEILEMYLNRIPYGHNAHGIEQASKIYFAKSASGLTLAEAAVLASLPQLPSYLSPYGKHVRTTLSTEGKERMRSGKLEESDDIRDEDFWIGLVGETFALQSGEALGPPLCTEESAPCDMDDDVSGDEGHSAKTLYIGGRTDQVLKNMEDQGFITKKQRLSALQELQSVSFKRARENIRAPHFVHFVREQVEELFADELDSAFLESGGLRIFTTIDWELQEKAEAIVTEIGELNRDLYYANNAALLLADARTGHILSYVGNRDYWDEETDGNVDVVRAPRQPGSSFKPFAYAASFLNGFNPATVLFDVPTKIGEDEPENFDGQFWGPLTIRKALGASRNIPAAKSYFLAGREDSIVNLAADMGIPSVRDRRDELSAARDEPYLYGWPLALGAAEVPLFEMVQGYTTFARGGKSVDLQPILRIEDRHGNILYESLTPPQERDVLDPRIAYMITSILSDESVRPAGYWREQLSVPGYSTAGKTGTSNRCFQRSAVESEATLGRCLESRPDNTWTLGYTTHLVGGAWAGTASGAALSAKASGLDTASHLWRRAMIAAHKHLQLASQEFPIPDGIESTVISEISGKLAASCTPERLRRAEIFLEGEEPREFDDACIEIEVDKLTGLLASDECPKEARAAGAHFVPRSVLPRRWPSWERDVQQWAADVQSGTGSTYWMSVGENTNGSVRKVFRGTGALLSLPLPLAPVKKCTMDLTPGRLIQPTVQIIFPPQGGVASAPVFLPKITYTVGHGIKEIRYELDGRLVGFVASGSDLISRHAVSGPPIRVTRRFDTSGLHTLRVTLIDSYENITTDSVRFTFEHQR